MDALEYAKAQTRLLRMEQNILSSLKKYESNKALALAGAYNFSLIHNNTYVISEAAISRAKEEAKTPNGDIDIVKFMQEVSLEFISKLQYAIEEAEEAIVNLPSLEEV